MKGTSSNRKMLKIEDQCFLKIVMYTKDSGKTKKEMEKVSKYGRTAQFTKDIGKIMKLMAMED